MMLMRLKNTGRNSDGDYFFAKRLVKEPDLLLVYSITAYLSHVVSAGFVPCDQYDLESPVQMKYGKGRGRKSCKIMGRHCLCKNKGDPNIE